MDLCRQRTALIIPSSDLSLKTEDLSSVLGTPMSDIYSERLDRLVKNCELVSLDVFDTAILRTVSHPTHIFAMMEQRFSGLIPKKLSFPILRIQAENLARMGGSEVTLDMIYEHLGGLLGIPSLLLEQIKAAEVSTELNCTVPNPQIQSFYQRALSLGKVVCFLSDMYLPARVIKAILRGCHYPVGEVYVSSEIGKSKHSGQLYRYLLDVNQLPARALAHIGDNATSDFAVPQTLGIHAFHYQPFPFGKAHSRYPSIALLPISKLKARATRDLFEKSGMDVRSAVLYRSAYSCGAILYLSFVNWLTSELGALRPERVFFCSRDGYILRLIYEKIRGIVDFRLPESDYFYISRKVVRLAQIKEIDEEELRFLCFTHQKRTLRVHLSRIGLDPTEFIPLISEYGFESLDQSITSPSDFTALKYLVKRLSPEILSRCSRMRDILLRYLKQMGFYSLPHVATVDVGWFGTVQNGLGKLLAQERLSTTLTGFYYGLFSVPGSKKRLDPGFRSFLCSDRSSDEEQWVLRRAVTLLELFHSAPHGGVVGYEEISGQIRPLFANNEIEKKQYKKWIGPFQNFAMLAIDTLLSQESWKSFCSKETCLEAIRELFHNPSPAEAELFGEWIFFDGFEHVGDGVKIAGVDHTNSSNEPVFNSYWKDGLLTRLASNPPHAAQLSRPDQPSFPFHDLGLTQE